MKYFLIFWISVYCFIGYAPVCELETVCFVEKLQWNNSVKFESEYESASAKWWPFRSNLCVNIAQFHVAKYQYISLFSLTVSAWPCLPGCRCEPWPSRTTRAKNTDSRSGIPVDSTMSDYAWWFLVISVLITQLNSMIFMTKLSHVAAGICKGAGFSPYLFLHLQGDLNLLAPRDPIWQGSKSTLVPVMAWCLFSTKPLPNQCWLIVNWRNCENFNSHLHPANTKGI